MTNHPSKSAPILVGLFVLFSACACLGFALHFYASPVIGARAEAEASRATATSLPAPTVIAKKQAATPPPTKFARPASPAAITPLPTRRPTQTPTPIPPTLAPAPMDAPALAPTSTPAAPISNHFVMARPVPPDASSIVPDWYYLYGTTEQGNLEVHHGVEFVNPEDTPLIAVANGTIVVAGPDDQPVCGNGGGVLCGPIPDFYGNLVVLRLDTPYRGQPVFALYGHMETVIVKPGQRVTTGQQIGTVGMTGVAQGPHVHFEVRLGVNDYAHTRDPLLWLIPLSGQGMIAGQVLDPNGNLLGGAEVDLLDSNGEQIQFSETYGVDDAPAVNGDDALHENFAFGDLPAGQYQVRVKLNGREYRETVDVQAGHLSFVVIRVTG